MPTETPSRLAPDPSSPCPCGSGRTLGVCCGPILESVREAATAEELMRARYTAHCVGNSLFLHRTYQGTAKRPYVADPTVPTQKWTRLEIHEHASGRTADLAYVDFSAHFTEDGAEGVLQEKAEFVRKEGRWIYTRAVRLGPEPVRSAHPKTGRNDPCPCGSGKKYKHCCLLK